MATTISPRLAADLQAALADACARMQLPSDGARLIAYTVNAVYRLDAPVVVRIATGETGRARGQRTVAAARWLSEHDAPAVRLLDGVQPVTIGDYTATFWHAEEVRNDWTAHDLAAPLRELHRIAADPALPAWDPFTTGHHRLAAADPVMTGSDLEWLQNQWAAVEQAYRHDSPEIPVGVVHGDPHIGNLLSTGSGRVIYCDLDETGIGPLAWDLVPQAVGASRFDRMPFYIEFAAAYGADVRDEPYWPLLARIRELIMVTSVLPDLGHRPSVAAEHAHRLASLRSGDTSAVWHPYR
ncbi:aminoglycoside phosphotransferase family protein [Nocardia sp. alder85J]|uniref:aminoglycoside phosphotransferase family protein n=1 Tax=Nocardia sp. alder85J TaxID=2862949 RepID=UPI001CD34F04|nr:aminoglycoside phosphotransferase family protein [Nocardia sp. alder85J]MCX4097752.1 aminoglycoside phosphotransferase family protein [Nocardia sp. alder85J]